MPRGWQGMCVMGSEQNIRSVNILRMEPRTGVGRPQNLLQGDSLI